MLKVEYTTRFKRDLTLCKRKNTDLKALQHIMKQIEAEKSLATNMLLGMYSTSLAYPVYCALIFWFCQRCRTRRACLALGIPGVI